MSITELSFRHSRLVWFLLVALVAGGIASYVMMSKLEDPEIKIKTALVITPYPGTSTNEVELTVTDHLEAAIKAMGDIQEIRSRSVPNMSEIMVTLRNTIADDEVEQYWDILRKNIADATSGLPGGASDPLVFDDFGDVFGLFYAMVSDGHSYEDMSRRADELKRRLLAVEGVRRVHVNGEQSAVININLEEHKMSTLGVHPVQIIAAVNNQTTSVYAGAYETPDRTLRIAVDHQLKSISEIEDIVIQGSGSSQVKLGDIARVDRSYEDPPAPKMFRDNYPALGISVSMESGENIITIGERVARCVEQFTAELPHGIHFEKVYFQSDEVNVAINTFVLNLLTSLAIVIILIMLLMGLRSGIVVGTSLLIAIAGTFPILFLLDGTIQRVSLGAFILAMGMLVDNGIVVVEGIWRDLKNGLERRQAALFTPAVTARPLLGATLIAIFAFLPAFLSPDDTGTYTRDLFLVLAISLLLSWVLALTQIPLMAHHLLSVSDKQRGKNLYDTRFFRLIRKAMEWCLRHPVPVLLGVVFLLGLSLFSFQFVKQSFFPEFVYKQAYLEYRPPAGTSPHKTEADLREITDWLLEQPGVLAVTGSVGETPTRYNLTRLIAERNQSYGEMIIEFVDYETRVALKPVIEDHVRAYYPDAYSRIVNYKIIFSQNLVEVEFSGPDSSVLRDLAEGAEKIMAGASRVDKATIRTNWEPATPCLQVHYHVFDGKRGRIERSNIGLSLMAATSGLPVARYFEDDRELPVFVKMTGDGRERIGNLENVPVWGLNIFGIPMEGVVARELPFDRIEKELMKPTPLSSVASVDLDWENPIVRRIDGQRAIKAQCDPLPAYTAADVLREIGPAIRAMDPPEGYSWRWRGEKGDQQKALRYILLFLPVTILLSVMVLLMLFDSYRKLIIIFLSILFSIIGIVPALLLLKVDFGFLTIVGSIGLMGMMIKNGVVLIDEIDRYRARMDDRRNAVVEASLSRVRPVFMASATTALGMAPLLTDPFFNSVAYTIIGGLMVGTVITLFIAPVLYFIFFGDEPPRAVADGQQEREMS
jgi:multidrug efflux pump subunit AcrB